jgi:hypothetical protein
MTMEDVEQVIEIRDPEINVEEIMNRIRERIRLRRAQAEAKGVDYDRLAGDQVLLAGSAGLGADLYYDLNELLATAESLGAAVAMRDRRIPILNPLLYRMEKLLHRLVVKYVNMLAGRQVAFNRTSAHALREIARALEASNAHIEELERRIEDIKFRIDKAH